jgi:hypothetical protein
MISEKNLNIGSEYTFDVFGSIDGQQTFTGTAIGVYDARYASIQDSEVLEVNIINNYPNLDADTKELLNNDPDYRAFPVLKLIDAQKVEFSIAFPWINDSTFKKTTVGQATVLVDGITADNIFELRAALVSNGFDVVKISLPV